MAYLFKKKIFNDKNVIPVYLDLCTKSILKLIKLNFKNVGQRGSWCRTIVCLDFSVVKLTRYSKPLSISERSVPARWKVCSISHF